MKRKAWIAGVGVFLMLLLAAVGAVDGAMRQAVRDGAAYTAWIEQISEEAATENDMVGTMNRIGQVALTLATVLSVVNAWVSASIKKSIRSQLMGACVATLVVGIAWIGWSYAGMGNGMRSLVRTDVFFRLWLIIGAMLMGVQSVVGGMIRRHLHGKDEGETV